MDEKPKDTPQLRIIYQISATTKNTRKSIKKREQHPEREGERGVRSEGERGVRSGGGVGEVP